MTLGEIVKAYRTQHRLTMEQFAQKSGLSKGYISMLEKNRNPNSNKPIVPSLETIQSVAAAMCVDLTQVLAQMEGKEQDMRVFELDNIMPLPQTRKIPLIGTIACGAPILAVENINEYVDIDTAIHADFALKCKGDSMINARIFDGDTVYIREQPMVENGEIAAVLIGETDSEATLKRVYRDEEKLRLCAENPMYPDMVFFHDEMNSVRVLGKAMVFLSAVR